VESLYLIRELNSSCAEFVEQKGPMLLKFVCIYRPQIIILRLRWTNDWRLWLCIIKCLTFSIVNEHFLGVYTLRELLAFFYSPIHSAEIVSNAKFGKCMVELGRYKFFKTDTIPIRYFDKQRRYRHDTNISSAKKFEVSVVPLKKFVCLSRSTKFIRWQNILS
jgi:hypothetical protein